MPSDSRRPILVTAAAAALLALGFSRPRSEAGAPSGAATAPAQAPARGLWDILLCVYSRISEDRIVALAAGVTFYALLAIFPAIAALVSIYGLFADPATITEHLNTLANVLPGGAIDIIGDQIKRVAAQGASKLGVTFLVGVAVSLWSANAGMKGLFDTLNVAYGETEKRGLVMLNLVSLAITCGAIVLLILALAVIAIVPAALAFVGLGSAAEILIDVLRWPAIVVVVALGIALVYRYGPSRPHARLRLVSWGSALACVLWLVVSILFSWYAAHFGSYNKTYGSLGAAVGFMTWIWLSTIIVLVGAELDAEIGHGRARPAPRPSP